MFMKILFILNFLFCQWGQDIRLTNNVYSSTLPVNNQRAIFSVGDTIHIVWEEDRDGNYEIYYKRSVNNGTTWENDFRLTNDPNLSMQPSICASGSNVHVVWLDTRDGNWEIYYKNSPNSGNSWSFDKRLTNNPSYSYSPCVFASGSYVHVIWVDERDGNKEIYYKRSTDGGNTWGSDFRLTNNPNNSTNPSLWVSGSNVHVVWQEDRDGNWEIYYKRSNDNGNTWTSDIRLTNNPQSSLYPSVSVFSSTIHVVWVDNRDGNDEIYYKRSIDGGNSWGSDIRLTNNTQQSFYPYLFSYGLNVHVVWTDDRDGNREIYYKRSIDGGSTWESDFRLTNNVNVSQRPFICVSGPNVHVIWQDNRDGNWEIYYKRNPTGNGVEEFNKEREFKIYKNLFIDFLNLDEKTIHVYDLNGRIVKINSSQIYFLKEKGKIFKVIKFR